MLYSDSEGKVLDGCSIVELYRIRTKLNVAVDSTAALALASVRDRSSSYDRTTLAHCYSMALIRMVNGLTDREQTGYCATPIGILARTIGLPMSLVTIRHDATHQTIPGIIALRSAAQQALEWLRVNYWLKVIVFDVDCEIASLYPSFSSLFVMSAPLAFEKSRELFSSNAPYLALPGILFRYICEHGLSPGDTIYSSTSTFGRFLDAALSGDLRSSPASSIISPFSAILFRTLLCGLLTAYHSDWSTTSKLPENVSVASSWFSALVSMTEQRGRILSSSASFSSSGPGPMISAISHILDNTTPATLADLISILASCPMYGQTLFPLSCHTTTTVDGSDRNTIDRGANETVLESRNIIIAELIHSLRSLLLQGEFKHERLFRLLGLHDDKQLVEKTETNMLVCRSEESPDTNVPFGALSEFATIWSMDSLQSSYYYQGIVRCQADIVEPLLKTAID